MDLEDLMCTLATEIFMQPFPPVPTRYKEPSVSLSVAMCDKKVFFCCFF